MLLSHFLSFKNAANPPLLSHSREPTSPPPEPDGQGGLCQPTECGQNGTLWHSRKAPWPHWVSLHLGAAWCTHKRVGVTMCAWRALQPWTVSTLSKAAPSPRKVPSRPLPFASGSPGLRTASRPFLPPHLCNGSSRKPPAKAPALSGQPLSAQPLMHAYGCSVWP